MQVLHSASGRGRHSNAARLAGHGAVASDATNAAGVTPCANAQVRFAMSSLHTLNARIAGRFSSIRVCIKNLPRCRAHLLGHLVLSLPCTCTPSERRALLSLQRSEPLFSVDEGADVADVLQSVIQTLKGNDEVDPLASDTVTSSPRCPSPRSQKRQVFNHPQNAPFSTFNQLFATPDTARSPPAHQNRKQQLDARNYLVLFLQYLGEVVGLMRSSGLEVTDHPSVLRTLPNHILARVVLANPSADPNQGLDQARRLAILMRVDLLSVVLKFSAPVGCSNSANRHLNPAMIAFIAELEATSKLQLLHYVGASRRRLLAPLACLLCACDVHLPLSTVPGVPDDNADRPSPAKRQLPFFRHAVDNSKDFPMLHRWICVRAQALATVLRAGHPHAVMATEFFSFNADSFAQIMNDLTAADSTERDIDMDQWEHTQLQANVQVEDCRPLWRLYQATVQRLCDAGHLHAALLLADASADDPAVSALILDRLCAAAPPANGQVSPRLADYISRVGDCDLAAHLTMQHCRQWDVETASRLLRSCSRRLEARLQQDHGPQHERRTLHQQVHARLERCEVLERVFKDGRTGYQRYV